jgi:cellulose synthase/poly-beta-1,6-N-acetylglucosamine synthase-like glycosyltransferase
MAMRWVECRSDTLESKPTSMPSAMLIAFYILAFQQILQGMYSLWEGRKWLRMVRKRLSVHGGFYTPQVALICPCKGSEPHLETNLTALTRYDYANYEIFFVLASNLDPAVRVIEKVRRASDKKVHIVIAGPPEHSSEKVSNLRKVVEQLDPRFEVIVFTDSDISPTRNWLSKMVLPLADGRVGAATTYRWLIPSLGKGDSSLATGLASAWNASVATMLGEHDRNFCWGGGTAIRAFTFRAVNALNFWDGAVSDDLALTNALQAANEPILFVPECIAPTLFGADFEGLTEFTNRQTILTRVYSQKMWTAGALAHTSYVVTLIFLSTVIFNHMLSGDTWEALLLMMMLIPLLSMAKGAMRTVAILEILPEWKKKLHDWSWVWTILAPVVPFLFFWNFCVSAISRTIRWRGIDYRLVSVNHTEIIRR